MNESGKTIKDLTVKELKDLIQVTIKETLEDELEDYIALRSKEYIQSIREAREDYKSGNIKKFDEHFPDV